MLSAAVAALFTLAADRRGKSHAVPGEVLRGKIRVIT